MVTSANATNEHVVRLDGLQPGTRYYYTVGHGAGLLATGPDLSFVTFPEPGQSRPTRLWVLGDSGTANEDVRRTRHVDVRDQAVDLRQAATVQQFGGRAEQPYSVIG
jgi:hypothetical protein